MTRTTIVLFALTALAGAACTPTGGPDAGPVPGAVVEPPIAVGASTSDARAATVRLLDAARAAVARADWAGAAESAQTVVEDHPTAPGSSEALRILARASLELGEIRTARTAAEQTLEMFGAGNPRHAEAQTVLGRVELAEGDTLAAMIRLAGLGPGGSPETVAVALQVVREVTPSLDAASLQAVAERIPAPGPSAVPILVEFGVSLYFQGEEARSAQLGSDALAAGAQGEEQRTARALAAGSLESVLGRAPLVAAMLPATGPPTLTRYGTLLEEGIRVAIEMERESARRPTQLRTVDDGGSAQGAASLIASLEADGASAVIGPLLDDALSAASRARRRGIPLLSPTARSVPDDANATYSLSGPDPGPAQLLARYAIRTGLNRVVLMYPRVPSSTFEADAFRDAFVSQGGDIVQELPYAAGTTNFEAGMRQVEELIPDALILPLQAADIELLAPQVTFFGLDTLGVRVLGTSEWASEDVLAVVDPRHTNGVVTASALRSGIPPAAATEFQIQYEAIFRKTLRSDVPALGFDAARLILRALESGARTPEEMVRALEAIQDFPGASGFLSFRDGLLVRDYDLVRLENRTLLPVFIP